MIAVLYFAYGSNMNWAQMKARCPSAQFIGKARFPDHRLVFSRKSKNRDCGVADAMREAGRSIWGAVYEISDLDFDVLDKAEGFRPGRVNNAYWRRDCTVFLGGDEKQPFTAQTYFAEREDNPPLPNQEYKEAILSGARHWNLPGNYIAELEAIGVEG